MQDSVSSATAMTTYSADSYKNGGLPYVVGYTLNYSYCHLIDGDQFTITKASGKPFKLVYDPIVSQYTNRPGAQYCKDFWKSVDLNYDSKTGILTGYGDDQFSGKGGIRYVSIALDRSHADPFVVHIYVSERDGGGQPEDGSATGTGKR